MGRWARVVRRVEPGAGLDGCFLFDMSSSFCLADGRVGAGAGLQFFLGPVSREDPTLYEASSELLRSLAVLVCRVPSAVRCGEVLVCRTGDAGFP